MSEEQIKIWKQVEAKGLEKLGNIEKALLAKEGFEEAHKDYCDFVDRLAETTGLTTGELDRHFTTLLAEKGEKKNDSRRKEEKKERNRKYGAICARAKAMGIMQGDAISAIMDIESADRKFNLRLDDFLGADNSNFAHDFIRIQGNIVRENFPATDFYFFILYPVVKYNLYHGSVQL